MYIVFLSIFISFVFYDVLIKKIHNYPIEEKTSIYNNVVNVVNLPNAKWWYSEISKDDDNSLIEIDVGLEKTDYSQLKDIVEASNNIKNYVRSDDKYIYYDILIDFKCFSAGRSFNFSVNYYKSGDLGIVYNWYGLELKDIAMSFPDTEYIEIRLFPGDNFLQNINDIAKFKQLKSITFIEFYPSKEDEMYILSVFPECNIIYKKSLFDL